MKMLSCPIFSCFGILGSPHSLLLFFGLYGEVSVAKLERVRK